MGERKIGEIMKDMAVKCSFNKITNHSSRKTCTKTKECWCPQRQNHVTGRRHTLSLISYEGDDENQAKVFLKIISRCKQKSDTQLPSNTRPNVKERLPSQALTSSITFSTINNFTGTVNIHRYSEYSQVQ